MIQEATITKWLNHRDFNRADDIIRECEPLVRHWVFKRNSMLRNTSIQEDDLLQEARCGVLHALTLFDPDKGSFSNYASWWINATIQRYSEKNISILTYKTNKHRRKIISKYQQLMNKYKSSRSSFSIEECHRKIADELQCPVEHVIGVAHEKAGLVHLDKKVRSREDAYALDLEDRSVTHPERLIDQRRISTFVKNLIKTRSPIERDIVNKRLLTDKPETLKVIASRYGLTRQRVEQIEKPLKIWIQSRCEKAFIQEGL